MHDCDGMLSWNGAGVQCERLCYQGFSRAYEEFEL